MKDIINVYVLFESIFKITSEKVEKSDFKKTNFFGINSDQG